MRKPWLAFALLLGAGCASAPVRPAESVTVNLEPADARRRQGCYDCLLEAREIYQRAAAGPQRAVALQRWFETELLIAVRERELALDNAVSLGRARALSAELPPALMAGRYVDDADRVPHEAAGWSRRTAASFREAQAPFLPNIGMELEWLRTGGLDPMVGEYLALALDCGWRTRPRPPAQPVWQKPVVPPDAPPLIRYRIAWCGQLQLKQLDEVRAEVPDFVETSYFQGAVAVAGIERGGGPNPHTLVAEVLKRFGGSPAVTMLAGNLRQTVGDCPQALTEFDKTIDKQPLHEDAWLGRTTCLTDVSRTDDAIQSASQMIERGLDNVDQAYYWRAWNQHIRGDLAAARSDINATRSKRVTPEILTLAGVIEHDQDDLAAAERDLGQALNMTMAPNCRARWYLGSVFVKKEQWRDAAEAFDVAMTCYDQDAHLRELLLAEIRDNPALDPDYKRARTARLTEQIAAQRHQQYSAAFNAANFCFSTGNLERAHVLVEIAARAPELSAEVAALRKYMTERSASPAPGPS